MPRRVGLGLTLVPEEVPASRKRKLPTVGLLREPLIVNPFGAIRRDMATHVAARFAIIEKRRFGWQLARTSVDAKV